MNTTTALDALSRLIQLSGDDSTDSKWIVESINEYLKKKDVLMIDQLTDEQRVELVNEIKSGFADHDQAMPDFLLDKSDNSVDDAPVTEKSESAEPTELDIANRKLEVAKNFLKDIDSRLARYESMDIDSAIELLEKYESIGTPEDIIASLKAKSESAEEAPEVTSEEVTTEVTETDATTEVVSEDPEKSKLEGSEEVEVEAPTSDDVTIEEDDPQNTEDENTEKFESEELATDNKGDEMSGQEQEVQIKHESEMTDDQKKLLARYQELGTPEEIEELVKRSEKMLEDNAELTDKSESLQEALHKYESIGTTEEILNVVEEFAGIKQKAESERISAELNIPVEKVTATIEKMESVSEAEALLKDLFMKSESAEVTEEDKPEVKNKHESDEQAEVVEEEQTLTQKSEAERMTSLGALMRKL